MKQILQSAKTGDLQLVEVPAPSAQPGQLLVRNAFSVVSPGTERLMMDFARKSVLAKARSRPDLVGQVVRKLRQDGPLATYRAVTTRLDAPQPLGYSCAGIVEDVGEGVAGFRPGDRVACAGAGYANHAEWVVVPENLAARVPPDLDLRRAAFATVGAIAMQGLRVASPTLGEIAAVVGLGLIGQLTVQLLRANGCRVLGIDLAPERVRQALDQGAEWAYSASDIPESWKDAATAAYGVDLALVTAAATSSAPIQLAAELCRQKGRVVVVGMMPMELERRAFYEKELDLRMSTSYGPGRYDRTYEECGLDYPLPYVRWTENRNLQSFLALGAAGAIDPGRLDVSSVPFEEAEKAYEELAGGRVRSLGIVFQYQGAAEAGRTLSVRALREPRATDTVGVSVVGAGAYANGVLLPALLRQGGVTPRTVIATTGPSARRTAERFRFEKCSTSVDEAFDDPDTDLVIIATRHDSHAELAARALRKGKAVWLEKPAALSRSEVALLCEAADSTGGFLSIGYNRRFSPHARAVRDAFSTRRSPLAIHYVVSAGATPSGTWIMDPAAGGGRIIGEVCHFVDLCLFLAGCRPEQVFARALAADPTVDDSTVALVTFADGSAASIEYLARASAALPKERFEVSADGRTATSSNYRSTRVIGGKKLNTLNQRKGQEEALAAVLGALRSGRPSPFPLDDIASVSNTTFALLESMRTGTTARVELEGGIEGRREFA